MEKQHEAQKELDALHATLDDPAQAPGLAGDVIAQAERMDVAKGFQRQLPQRALAHTRKDRVAQLVESHAHDAHEAIGDHQPDRRADQQEECIRSPVLGRQRIHGSTEEGRDRYGQHLGDDQRGQSKYDTDFYPGLALGPQIGDDLADCSHTAAPLDPGRITHACIPDCPDASDKHCSQNGQPIW